MDPIITQFAFQVRLMARNTNGTKNKCGKSFPKIPLNYMTEKNDGKKHCIIYKVIHIRAEIMEPLSKGLLPLYSK